MSSDEQTLDGFRRLLTRAPFIETLAANPSDYDAAPAYLVEEYRRNKPAVQREVAKRLESDLAEKVQDNTAAAKARLVLEVGAPAAFDVVRTVAIVGLVKKFVLFANPAIALVSVPALFLSGKQTMASIRRSIFVDPAVRDHIKRAQFLSERGNYRKAEECLKEALELDIDPRYGRNGDLWMQLGLVQLQDQRAREAMVSLAKASVLFGENDEIVVGSKHGEVKVSKRGLAEMLACAAIDSFTNTLEGLDEWEAIVSDFARSAAKRLEAVAAQRERGRLLGMFGIETESAEFGRELAAKVQFLAAKMQLKLAAGEEGGQIDELIGTALQDLKSAALTPEELSAAILEQAQFYCELLMNGRDVSAESISRALELFEEAADAVEGTDTVFAARVRAEAAWFAIQVIPQAVATGEDVSPVRQRVLRALDRLAPAVSSHNEEWDFAPLARGWIEEQKVRLHGQRDLRHHAAQKAHEIFLAAGEPVAAMQNTLRMAYFAENEEAKEEALRKLIEGAQSILDGEANPVTRAFAAKYFLDAGKFAGSALEGWTRERSAQLFLEAASYVRKERMFVPFYLNGKAVIHAWQVAEVILRGQAAAEFARAGMHAKAISLYENVRMISQDYGGGWAIEAIEIEYSQLLIETGELKAAKDMLDGTLREARRKQLPAIQHRTLHLLHQIQAQEDDALLLGNQQDTVIREREEEHSEMLSRFSYRRQLLSEVAKQTLDIIDQTGVFTYSDALVALEERLRGRLLRLEEGRFRIGIVGEFSAGKSTLLNALFGKNLLPSSIRPTTATVIRVQWAGEPRVCVVFQDNTEEVIEFDSLSNFVMERRNPGNERGVAEVQIGYPLPLLKNGIELIDTPGVSSLIDAHSETTYELIPSCDAVVLLATGRQPFSESISQFLNDLRLVVEGKVFYVLNKIDQLTEEGRQQALSFAEERVAEHVQGAQVLPLSAYQALMSRMVDSGELSVDELTEDPRVGDFDSHGELLEVSHIEDLEEFLSSFLENQRGLPLLRDVAESFLRAQSEMTRLIEVELEVAEMDREKRRKAHRELARKHNQRRLEVERELEALEDGLHDAIDTIITRPSVELPKLADEIVHQINLSPADLANESSRMALKQRVLFVTRRVVDDFSKELSDQLSKDLGWYQINAKKRLRKLQKELQLELRTALNIGDDEVSLQVHVDSKMKLDDVDDDLFTTASSVAGQTLLGGALGVMGVLLLGPIGIGLAVFGSVLGGAQVAEYFDAKKLAKAERNLQDELKQGLGNIAVELRDQFKKGAEGISESGIESIRELASEIHGEFDGQLNLLIEEGEDDVQSQRRNIEELRGARKRVAGLRENLAAIVALE